MRFYSTHQKDQSGYSFVEVLVAITVLLLGIVGPLTIASKGLQNARFAREQNTALFLAQEGIEAMHHMRTNEALSDFNFGFNGLTTWNWIDDISSPALPSNCYDRSGAGCAVFINDDATFIDTWRCAGRANDCQLSYTKDNSRFVFRDRSGAGTLSPYTRRLYFENISSNAIKIISVVSWEASAFGGREKEVELETVIYDVYGNEFSS